MQNHFGFQNHDHFPIDSLPENLRSTLLEVERMVHSPIGLIASSMLATMAIACQGALNVRTPTGQVLPTSLFIMTIAESGERKTGTDTIFSHPIRDFEEKRRRTHDQELAAYESKKSVWEIRKQELDKSVRKAIIEHKDTESLRAAIEHHLQEKPTAPLQTRLIYSDTTIEALLKNLADRWPSGAIQSSEALSVFSGRTFHNLSPFNELWDGVNYINVDRKNAESYELKNSRLSISLMSQLQPFVEFLAKKSNLAINSGFVARFLIAMPTSTQGSRKVEKNTVEKETSNTLQEFRSCMTHWLEKSEERILQNLPYQEMSFESLASQLYLDMLSYIEKEIQIGRSLHGYGAIASKLGNNLARLAALIQVFSYGNLTIENESLQAAYSLITWYCNQHINFIKISNNELSDHDKGDILYEWLYSHIYSNQSLNFKVTDLYRNAPNSIRGKINIQLAINNLEVRGLIVNNRQHRPMTISPLAKISPYQPAQPYAQVPNFSNETFNSRPGSSSISGY